MLIFDEGHRAKNFFGDDRRGSSTQTGAAVVEIQDPEKFLDFRIICSSATAATEVRHLAYYDSARSVGQGIASADFAEFAAEIEEGGVGAMEMVCRDLKAMGRYFCGSLSMGVVEESELAVEYCEVIHHLTTHQREMYDIMARAWQAVIAENRKGSCIHEQREVFAPVCRR